MRGESILIVDDEKLIRWSLSKEMTNAGFTVFEAETVESALEIIREKEPDVVLLDQHLPDRPGMEVLKMIKESDLGIPVIMLTIVDKSDIAVQAMKLGAFD
ncbi:MAG: response regulator, partial [Chlorobi bacterium]|nr:response regulator [Chlorobiota bacterium]